MKQRCLNPKNPSFYRYGQRGIKVCDRWLHSFENFVEDLGIAPKGLTIERIDNNGNYCKENCRWITNEEQALNRSTNKYITHNGETLGICEWAKRLGGSVSLVTYRLKNGWNPIAAITIRPDLGNKYNLLKHIIY
jgi:hypothetical protein